MDAGLLGHHGDFLGGVALALSTDDDEGVLILLGKFLEVREAGDAGRALDAPTFEDHGFASELPHGDRWTADGLTPSEVAEGESLFLLIGGKGRNHEQGGEEGQEAHVFI